MRIYLISDNNDTLAGLRLSGVDGVVLHEREEVEAELERICSDSSVGIILITKKLCELCKDKILTKKKSSTPLILEIPDRHGDGFDSKLSADMKGMI